MKKYMCAGLLLLLIAPIHAMEKEEEDAPSHEGTTIPTGPVTACALSEETLATSNYHSQKAADIITLWNIKSKTKIREIKPKEAIGNPTHITWHEKKLAVNYDDGLIVLFDAETGKQTCNIATQDKGNMYLSFNLDGSSILSSWAQNNTENGELEKRFPNQSSYPLTSISPDGSNGGAFNPYYNPELRGFIYDLINDRSFGFEKLGPLILTNQGYGRVEGNQVVLYEYNSKKNVTQRFAGFYGKIKQSVRNLKSTHIACSSTKDKKVILWDIESGNAIQTIQSENPQIIEFSADGNQLAIASANEVEVVDIQ